MGIAERIFDEELAAEEAFQPARGADGERFADAPEAPSCSAAMGARSIEELVVPI